MKKVQHDQKTYFPKFKVPVEKMEEQTDARS